MDEEIQVLAKAVVQRCIAAALTLATAESCTGGLVAGALTEIAGSSAVLDRGFVTYSNEAKLQMLSVPAETIGANGAVSRETAEAMAMGVLMHAPVNLSVAVTGIAGPGGATPGKPVGLVHFAAASSSGLLVHERFEFGDLGRAEVRRRAVIQALTMLLALAERPPG